MAYIWGIADDGGVLLAAIEFEEIHNVGALWGVAWVELDCYIVGEVIEEDAVAT